MEEKHLLELMQRHGVKPTANRIVIARTLAAAGRPLSMTELETRVETIDKSNVFRTLQTFREAHLVHVLDDSGDGVRYELCHRHDDDQDDDDEENEAEDWHESDPFGLYHPDCDREIFQWFLTDCSQNDVEYLEEHFGLLFTFSDVLDLYVLCVDHFGTSWKYVHCDTDLECAAREEGQDR